MRAVVVNAATELVSTELVSTDRDRSPGGPVDRVNSPVATTIYGMDVPVVDPTSGNIRYPLTFGLGSQLQNRPSGIVSQALIP